MKKVWNIFFMILLMSLLLSVSAFASGEPSGEPSAEPSGEPSGGLAEGPMDAGFDVTIRVNGEEYKKVEVGVSVDENVYSFAIGDLLDALGVTLTYDEDTDTASITADVGSVLEDVIAKAAAVEEEKVEKPDPDPDPDELAETAVVDETVPATDGTENQGNVLDETGPVPEDGEAFRAYVDYLTDYMTHYDGIGDGNFDDGARDMALGELTSVGFGANVYAFPFEMFVTQFGAKDYGAFVGG